MLYWDIVSTFEEDEPHIAKILLRKEANFDVPGHVNLRKSGIYGSNSPHAVIEGRPQRINLSYVQYTTFCVFPEIDLGISF